MKIFLYLILIANIPISNLSRSFRVVQDDMTCSYYDKNIMEAHANIYKLNRTLKAVNVTFILFKPFLNTDTVKFTGKKWYGNEYRPGAIQFGGTIPQVLAFQYFGFPKLLSSAYTPPLKWPLLINTTYRCKGWYPSSDYFAPNHPEGKWNLVTQIFRKDTVLLEANWFYSIIYYVN